MKSGSASTYVAIFGLLALAALFAGLGAWQLRRAGESRATIAEFESGAGEVLAGLPPKLDDDVRFRRVEVDGAYIGEPQFLLDNMLHEGAVGFEVLTALRVTGVERRVLVNRGWVPAGRDRASLPDVAIDERARTVSGRLERLPRPALRLGEEPVDHGEATVVLLYPTAEQLARRLGSPVFDYQLLLDPGSDDGYVRDWRAPTLSPERHLSYAGQWLALGLGAFAAAIVMAVKAMRRGR